MRELLEVVLAITLAVLGATAFMGLAALLICSLSVGTCWLVYRRVRVRITARREQDSDRDRLGALAGVCL
jgi:hypothetical protein